MVLASAWRFWIPEWIQAHPACNAPPRGSRRVELVDATGSGDVGMTTRVRSRDGGATITGLSLRPLLLNPAWDNPSGEFRVGLKAAYELFPRELLRRVRAERVASDREALAASLGAAQAAAAAAGEEAGGEFSSRAALLEAFSAGPGDDDAGFAFDVVSFLDSAGVWRVAVDTVGDGDLRAARALAPFSVAQEWGTFGGNTLLNYGVGVHAGGDVVSLVCDAGAHGTHVAGIVGAYHPGAPHLNGVAPGVQIIGIKIGDTRIGSMETGAGLIRGIAAAVAAGAHVVNMSYGEPSGRPNAGRFLEKARTAVLEKGLVFFASAGNAGPALSTVGAPGGNSQHIIGVGAAVTRAMMDEQYALRAAYSAAGEAEGGGGGGGGIGGGGGLFSPPRAPAVSGGSAPAPTDANHRAEDTNFTWSSRGPCMDGGVGVSVCAPGGAITCIPTWCLARHQQMNGTSMSSPNAAGCAALLLSGLRARGLPWTPYAVRRALEASAAPIPGSTDASTAGSGMLQVVGAWDRLLAAGEAARAGGSGGGGGGYPFGTAATGGGDPAGCAGAPLERPSAPLDQPVIEVTVPDGGAGVGEAGDRGIYFREPAQAARAGDAMVWVTPTWREGAPPAARVSFQLRITLSSTAPAWLSVPSHITLASTARSFSVHVDPRALAPGRAHFAEVLGVAALEGGGDDPLGPLFRIPVTVIKPEEPIAGATACTYAFAPREGPDCVMHGLPGGAARASPAPAQSGGGGGSGGSGGGGGGALPLAPGRMHRRFLAIPHGATWAEVVVSRVDGGAPGAVPRARGGGGSSGGGSSGGGVPPSSPPRAAPAPPFAGLEEAARGAQDALTRVLSPREDFIPPAALTVAPLASPLGSGGARGGAPADASTRLLIVHAMQLCRNVSPKQTAEDSYLRLAPGEADGIAFPLFSGGRTLEVAVAQFWSALGATAVEVVVKFHGVHASCGDGVTLTTAAGFAALTLTPLLHDVTLRPVGKLCSWTTLLPAETPAARVVPLPPGRDTPLSAAPSPAPAYALNLRYKLALGADVAGASLRLPALSGLLYESGVDAQLAVVATATGGRPRRAGGRVVAATDVFPEKLRLKKGEYTVHVQVRSESSKKLAALAAGGAPALEFTRKLEGAAEVALGVAGAHPGGAAGGAALGRLRAGLPQTVFVTAPVGSAALPKDFKAGDFLSGWLLLEDDVPRNLLKLGRSYGAEAGGQLVGRHPKGLPVTLLGSAGVAPPAGEKREGDAPSNMKSPAEAIADALRAAALAQLKSLVPGRAVKGKKARAFRDSVVAAAGEGGAAGVGGDGSGGEEAPPLELAPPLRAPFGGTIPAALVSPFAALSAAIAECSPPGYVPLLAAQLAVVEEEVVGAQWTGEPPASPAPLPPLNPAPALDAAAALVAAIDARALAAYFGTRHEAPPHASKAVVDTEAAEAKRCGDAKAALVNALWCAVRAQCHATWAAVSAGNAAFTSVPPTNPRSGGGGGGGGALPAVALPPAPANDGFEAAVAALNAWAPTTGAVGPHAPLIAVERALRAEKWGSALDAVQKAAPGALGGLHPLSCEMLRLFCALALGWARPAARLVEATVMNYTAWPVML